MNLKAMMADQATPAVDAASSAKANNAVAYLAQYNSFPAFPTSFILAADTSIEVSHSPVYSNPVLTFFLPVHRQHVAHRGPLQCTFQLWLYIRRLGAVPRQ